MIDTVLKPQSPLKVSVRKQPKVPRRGFFVTESAGEDHPFRRPDRRGKKRELPTSGQKHLCCRDSMYEIDDLWLYIQKQCNAFLEQELLSKP